MSGKAPGPWKAPTELGAHKLVMEPVTERAFLQDSRKWGRQVSLGTDREKQPVCQGDRKLTGN